MFLFHAGFDQSLVGLVYSVVAPIVTARHPPWSPLILERDFTVATFRLVFHEFANWVRPGTDKKFAEPWEKRS